MTVGVVRVKPNKQLITIRAMLRDFPELVDARVTIA
jgi:hypothetical protein